jgi:hypothetical protein
MYVYIYVYSITHHSLWPLPSLYVVVDPRQLQVVTVGTYEGDDGGSVPGEGRSI